MSQDQKHLSAEQMESLLDATLGGPYGNGQSEFVPEARQHLASCEACQRLLSMHKGFHGALQQLRQAKPVAATNECPPENAFNELLAGLVNEKDAEKLVTHASHCDHCGPLLREAAEIFDPQETHEEAASMIELQSSKAEWQARLARQLASVTSRKGGESDSSGFFLRHFSWIQAFPRWTYAVAAAVVLASVATSTVFWHSRPGYTNRLLAEAYTEHRTLEVRIPRAKYAPMRVERGAGASSLDKPPSLLKAEELISEGLRKNPDDPRWLQAKARADLLDGNYESSIKSLQRALETQPESPSLLTDVASAYFERAEATDRPIDYGNAVESLSRALAKSPDDPIALFNRALACERMFLYAQAIDDWEHYLRVDPTGAWADAARASLERVKQKKAARDPRAAPPLLSPADFSATLDANRAAAVAILDPDAEQYLQTAIQSWMPLLYSDDLVIAQASRDDARRALKSLADILKIRHDDTWLASFLQNRPDSNQAQALHFLLASDEAFHAGRYALSADRARISVRYFQRSNNNAGMLRATFALMLAQSFELKFADCLATAASALPKVSGRHYSWLQSQLLIQEGECQDGSANIEDALRNTAKGGAIAKSAHYPSLELRAIAFGAARRSDIGGADGALRELRDALLTFWNSDVSNTRGENLYSVLSDIALARDWRFIEVFSIAEILADFPLKDHVDLAVQEEILAGAQESAGEFQEAQATLRHVASQIATLPEDAAINTRKAEIALEDAKILLQVQDANAALIILAGLRPQFEKLDPGLLLAEYFKAYGEAFLVLHREAEAQPLLERALSISEKSLSGLDSEADKLAWSRTRGLIYRDLLQIKLKSESPAEALAWWEWYRGASLRSARTHRSSSTAAPSTSFQPPPISNYEMPAGTVLVSYVVLENLTTAFILRDGRVRLRTLPLHTDPRLRGIRFLHLCTDPSRSLESFQAEGRQLYEALVAPLEDDIQGAAALRLETDGDLDRIPFDLLLGSDGRYLSDHFEISYSPGLAYGSNMQPRPLSSASSSLIVVAPQAQRPSQGSLPEAVEEGNEVAAYFSDPNLLSGSQVTRENVLNHLRKAQEFHFVGHALASVDHVGLLLGPESLLDAPALVAARPRDLRLAVLSACDTANGDEGTFADVNSIARTLAVAGVPQTVASRWGVDSAVTRVLMRAFYSNLMSGKTPAHSLRAASLTVRGLPGYQHPYYWGSFAVFGSS